MSDLDPALAVISYPDPAFDETGVLETQLHLFIFMPEESPKVLPPAILMPPAILISYIFIRLNKTKTCVTLGNTINRILEYYVISYWKKLNFASLVFGTRTPQ
jgi:hypothetical protein